MTVTYQCAINFRVDVLLLCPFPVLQPEGQAPKNTHKKAPIGAKLLILLEARAGVEPTYTDLQSGA